MKIFKRFNTNLKNDQLTISKIKKRQLLTILPELVFFIVWYLFLLSANIDTTIGINYLIYLFYLVPLTVIPRWIKKIKIALNGQTLTFNLRLDEFRVNNEFKNKLNRIKKVELNYDGPYDISTCFLDLRYIDGSKYRIEDSDAVHNKELIDIAKKISKFIKVELIDSHPYEEKI